MMLFRRGNRKMSTHRTPLIWRQIRGVPNVLDTPRISTVASHHRSIADVTCRLRDQDLISRSSRKFSGAVRFKLLWGHPTTYPMTRRHSGRSLKITTTFV
jgi:hypothetical protein